MKLLLFIVIGALICVTVKSSEPSPFISELINENGFILAEGFQCLVGIVGKISYENGLADLWSQSEPVIQYFLNKWLNCPQAGGKWAVFLCNFQEGTQFIKLFREYLQSVAVQNPQALKLIAIEILKSCTSIDLIEQLLPGILNEPKLNVFRNGGVESAFPVIWSRYQPSLDASFAQIQACKELIHQKAVQA